MSRTLYLYVDESGTPGQADKDNFMLGAFLTETPISRNLIDKALNNLKKDNKNTAKDRKTIARSYFHASEDSPDAHSHLCTQIREISYPCEFFFDVINKDLLSQKDTRDIGAAAKMHRHLLSIISVHFTQGHFDTIEFFIAERQGSFEKHDKEQWTNDFIEAMVYSAIKTPQIPISLPEFHVTVTDGALPGIQVCDFVLWAVQRAVHRNDSTWFNRSGLLMSSSYRIDNDPLYGNNYYLNDYISNNILLPLESIPKPSDLEKHWTQNGIYNGMVNIELQLRSLANQIDCIKNTMLKDRLIYLIPKLEEVKLHKNIIIEMAKLYLLLADQIPFYDKNDESQIELVYHYKKICSKTADFYHISWVKFCNDWRNVRQWIYENDKKIFWDSAKEI